MFWIEQYSILTTIPNWTFDIRELYDIFRKYKLWISLRKSLNVLKRIANYSKYGKSWDSIVDLVLLVEYHLIWSRDVIMDSLTYFVILTQADEILHILSPVLCTCCCFKCKVKFSTIVNMLRSMILLLVLLEFSWMILKSWNFSFFAALRTWK